MTGFSTDSKKKGPGKARSSAVSGRPGNPLLAAAIAAMLLLVAVVGLSSQAAFAFTPGENGHPTSGNLTDLKGRGGNVTFDFQTNATLTCNSNTATSFSIKLDYVISGAPLPAGATVVVYLSPNQGAINGMQTGDVVEVSCRVDQQGVHVMDIGAVPPAQLQLMQTIKRYEYLAIEAIHARSRAKAVEALMVHPLVLSYPRAKVLVDDYLTAHKNLVGEWR